MFYCNKCAKAKGWPIDIPPKLYGPCEVCGKVTSCNDVPSKNLSIPNDRKIRKKEISNEIMQIVEIKEEASKDFNRCIDTKTCPLCGNDLVRTVADDDENFTDAEYSCNNCKFRHMRQED